MEYVLVKLFTNDSGVVYYKEIACGPYVYVMVRKELEQDKNPQAVYEVFKEEQNEV